MKLLDALQKIYEILHSIVEKMRSFFHSYGVTYLSFWSFHTDQLVSDIYSGQIELSDTNIVNR